jgi:hypothetical protein
VNTKAEPREQVPIRLRPESARTLERIQVRLFKSKLKCSRGRAAEYALAYVQMALDAGFDPIEDVLNENGKII